MCAKLNCEENERESFIYLIMSFIHIIQFTNGLHEGEEVHPATAINARSDLEIKGKKKKKKLQMNCLCVREMVKQGQTVCSPFLTRLQ